VINRKKKEKIGLFGGTFDPIHLGHTIIAEWIKNYLELNEIIFIPNKIHPFSKRENIIPADIRAEMIQKAINNFPYFKLSTIELKRPGISYTVDTIRSLMSEFPNAEIYLIMGEDNLAKFESWKEATEILNLVQVVTFRRRNDVMEESVNINTDKMLKLKSPYIDISSTEIRDRIKNSRNFQSLLYPDVYQYIVKHNLYKQTP